MRRQSDDRSSDLEAIAVPLEFEVERSGARARRLIMASFAFIAASLLMLGLSPFNNVVVAMGAVAQRGEPVAAHHDSGGAVDMLLVARGDWVEAGQPLLRLRSDSIESEIRELTANAQRAALRIERLRALLDGRPTDFSGIEAEPMAIEAEHRLYDADAEALASELASLEAQKTTRLRSAEALQLQADILAEAAAPLRERRDMLRELLERGAASRTDLLQAETRLAETEATRAGVLGTIAEEERGAEELDRRAASLVATQRAEWLAELASVLTEAESFNEQIERRRVALEQRTIVAPVAGAVLRLGGGGPGGVIDPGGMVAEIVPDARPLVAEIRIPPDKIGEVDLGDEVRIFITTFETSEFGDVRGELTMIAPSAITDTQGESYYLAEVTLPEAVLADGRLRPGMSLSTNILGAERTILGYLIRPFVKGANSAFNEG